jgi:IS30 family transposase
MPYHHFTDDERDALQLQWDRGSPVVDIAQSLGKHPASVYRELNRNAIRDWYISHKADDAARGRRQENRPSPVRSNIRLMANVEHLIKAKLAPEQIVGRLRIEHAGKSGWAISHETIYKYIYDQARHGGLDLRDCLRHGHKARRKRRANKDRRGIIPDRVFIDDRPNIVTRKQRFGDWEADTIEGAGKKGYVATFVERKSKYVVAYPLKNKTAESFTKGAARAFRLIPAKRRKTITVDNGKEFAAHKVLAHILGATVYFAHPYHSWERGLNEHTNGLIRQYLPKNRSLLDLSSRELAWIVRQLNNRPRKSLGYRTPREVFFKQPLALQT